MSTISSIKVFARAQSRPRRRLVDDEHTEETLRNRMVLARQMNRLDQKEAALLLGYQNSSQLSKVEAGEAPMPKNLLRKASLAYGVSTDWLLGLSSEPERDPRTAEQMAIMRAVTSSVVEHTRDMTGLLLRAAAEQMPMETRLRSLLSQVRDLTQTFDRVLRNNETFNEEIRGGATLTRGFDELVETTVEIERFFARRQGIETARAETTGANMPLFDDNRD